MTKAARFFCAIIVAVLIVPFVMQSTTHAVTGSSWSAGRIIDDGVFRNNNSMSVDQIQAFLNSKVPTCDTNGSQTSEYGGGTRAQYGASRGNPAPYVCLKNYWENVDTKQNNLGGAAIPAGAKSAARIIYDYAQQYRINPQVLIVLLQKEQGLITDDWPWAVQYRSATGYGCPDTAPCDSQYYGFSNQVRWASRMFQAIMDSDPDWYTPYTTGSNYVLWNPNTACGGTNVNIQNRATAALYSYTPYQPNQAALNNLYGTGDSCSSYGNRNFWRYFNDWFGLTTGNLVRASTGGVYLLENGAKRAFPSELAFFSYGYSWQDVVTVSATELSAMPDGAAVPYNVHFRDQRLVSAPSGGVYAIENGQKRAFPSTTEFLSHGYKWTDVLGITAAEVALIPDGTPVEYNVHFRDQRLVSAPGGGVYAIENGKKRAFPGATEFLSWSYKWTDVLGITAAEVALIPDGTPVEYNVHFREGRLVTAGGGIYLVQNGLKRPFPSEPIFLSYGYSWSNAWYISGYEMNLIPDGAAMPPKS